MGRWVMPSRQAADASTPLPATMRFRNAREPTTRAARQQRAPALPKAARLVVGVNL